MLIKNKKFLFIIFCFCFLNINQFVLGAPVFDYVNGTYNDDFANTTGIPTRSNTTLVSGHVELTKSGSNYNPLGYAITQLIRPPLLAKWGTITLNANVPENTSIKIQILDDTNGVFGDAYLAGNSVGIESLSLDIGTIPILACSSNNCNKPYTVKIKLILATSDPLVSPTIESLSFNWVLTQGDLSPSTISSSPWPAYSIDQKGTNYSPYFNSYTYPAFKWASEKYIDEEYIFLRGIFNDKILGYSHFYNSYIFARDRDTGQELLKIPFETGSGPEGVISSNGTFYGTDMGCDGFYVIDINSGQLKWVYNFIGGHGNDQTVLGRDGTIYTIRSQGAPGRIATIYAFNSNGTIKWQADYTLGEETDYRISVNRSSISTLGENEILYFGFYTLDIDYNPTNNGKLYAINLLDGSLSWSYATGDLNSDDPIIDNNGNIYVFSKSNWSGGDSEKKIYAFNPNGTLKWEKSYGVDAGEGFYNPSLGNDGNFLVLRNYPNNIYNIEKIRISDGELIFSESLFSDYSTIQFLDSNNNYILIEYNLSENGSEETAFLNYYNNNNNLKWSINYPYNPVDESNNVYFNLEDVIQDERGWIYAGFAKGVKDPDWNIVLGQSFGQTFALAPWIISVNKDLNHYHPGDTINFTVTTSMLEENVLLGGDNKIQIVMNNNDKVFLNYNSTDLSGNTIWTGSYVLPSDIAEGSYSYTVEASQSYLQTDISTHFASPTTQSNNTGITKIDSFIVSTGPLVTKIGDGSGDVELQAGNTDLVFSEELASSSKLAVENALTSGANKSLSYSWSGGTLTITATEITIFNNDVVVNVADYSNHTRTGLLIIDSILSSDQASPINGLINIDNTIPKAVITDPTQPNTITINNGTNNPVIDVSSFINNGAGVLPEINIISNNANNVTVQIPASTTVSTTDTSWNGIITAPIITNVTIPGTESEFMLLDSAIQIGFSEEELSFDKSVRLLFPGKAGKRVGYVKPESSFIEITNNCVNDNGDSLGSGESCKISINNDLIIWTRHFTSFALFVGAAIFSGGNFDTSLLDNVPPQILDVSIKETSMGAIITWKTTEESLTWLVINNQDFKKDNFSLFHEIILEGLFSNTNYSFQIKTKDTSGNTFLSPKFNFKTLLEDSKTSNPLNGMTRKELVNFILRLIIKLISQGKFNLNNI